MPSSDDMDDDHLKGLFGREHRAPDYDDAKHREAMDLMDRAMTLHRESLDIFEQAARLEQACADNVASDKHRTRGILCVSAVSLWLAAERWETARAVAEFYLGCGLLSPGFAEELHTLIRPVVLAHEVADE